MASVNHVFKPAVRRRAVKKQNTGMQRTMQAFHMQTKLPTSKMPDCLGATLRAGVRTEKENISGWAGGLVCSCKNEKQIAQGQCSNLQSRPHLWLRMLLSLLPTSSIRTSIQRTGVQTGCRSQGSQKAKHKHAKDNVGIPHADQAANVKDPRLPGCDAPCQCTHGKRQYLRMGGWACLFM